MVLINVLGFFTCFMGSVLHMYNSLTDNRFIVSSIILLILAGINFYYMMVYMKGEL
jgi:hypothetical protein